MPFLKFLKSSCKCIKNIKDKNSQANEGLEYKSKIHEMKTAFDLERIFLSDVADRVKEHINNKEFSCNNFQDISDIIYKKLDLIGDFSNKKSSNSLLKQKQDYFIRKFIKIKLPELYDLSVQKTVENTYNQYFTDRQNRLGELRGMVEKSESFTNILCTYLSRSNYPKNDAFEILPKTMEYSFDIERSNSKHLKGASFLDSILG
jgi:hypothetical protein